ncbi:MAG: DUF2793 domain-containing protein [Pseudomonadota bacterium]
MAETYALKAPLVEAAQAQKHVTVNEALWRLDGVLGGVADSVLSDTAPVGAAEGSLHVVGTAPTGDWAGQAQRLAQGLGGGWSFFDAPAGTVLTEAATGRAWGFDGRDWVEGRVAGRASGAATVVRVVEIDHALASGASSTVTAAVPGTALVLGVTARVSEAIGGAASWSLGMADSNDRYGSGLGVAVGSYALGLTGAPLTYYSATDLVLTAAGGDFTAGRVSIAIHVIEIRPPSP